MPLPSLSSRARRVALLVLLVALGAGGWFLFIREADDSGSPAKPAQTERTQEKKEPVLDDPIVRKMSVEEQVSQVLMLGFEGTAPGEPTVAEIGDENLGAVLVRSENWTDSDQGKKLVAALGEGAEIPPLVVASQEGGDLRSFPDLPPGESALEIGREDSPDAAQDWARATSAALAGAGFHLNLFPVADVATLDSPLAGRAFSDDPDQVASLTESALDGCEEGGIACAPLHFPGLGTASQDTNQGPATIATDLATLTSRDLIPFGTKAAREAPAMVLSLGLYPDFDPIVPGALTPKIATQLLRGDVGFKGVAISDDLGAGAVKATYSVPEAAVAALRAGVDLIQVASPDDAEGVAKALERAVASGKVDPRRLAQAAERVVDLKRKLDLIED
ncbi:MAG: hypothetical protein M3331_04265 [Actinomycetota bacterium]|nr:hypothetical protein [Actinomycetota bacterium]